MKISILILFVILCSCSSNSKKARKFMEAGSWEKAREMWVLVLQKKPADEEALAGKKAAEFKIANKYVIATQRHRESGDHRGAMESALTIHDYLIDWKESMDPDMAKFQKKELVRLYPSYLKIIEESITGHKPLKASYDQQRFYPLFESIQKGEVAPIKKRIKQEGQTKCRELKDKGTSYPFWRQFVAKYCAFYKVDIKEKNTVAKELFSQLSINTQIDRMPAVDMTIVKRSANNAFKNSAWYHLNGQNSTSTTIYGSYKEKNRIYKEPRIKQYTISKKEDARLRGIKNSKETGFITKSFNYYVTVQKQNLEIALSNEISLNGQEIQIAHKNEHKKSDWSYRGHSERPRISAKKIHLPSPQKWFNQQYEVYQKEFAKGLRQLWTQNYCQTNGKDLGMEAMGDYVLRCLRAKDDNFEAFINSWHMNHFGIDWKGTKTLLGRYY